MKRLARFKNVRPKTSEKQAGAESNFCLCPPLPPGASAGLFIASSSLYNLAWGGVEYLGLWVGAVLCWKMFRKVPVIMHVIYIYMYEYINIYTSIIFFRL